MARTPGIWRMLLVRTLLAGGPALIPAAQSAAQLHSTIAALITENGSMPLTTAEAPPGQTADPDQADLVASAERAAVRAVNFRQGDAAGFNASRDDFTEAGWRDFVNHMQGYLDDSGAPTFTSAFVASGSARVLDEKNGVRNGTVRFRIPGTLTQTNKIGRTTYRGAIEVTAGGTPTKIQKLEQITCLGASTACQ